MQMIAPSKPLTRSSQGRFVILRPTWNCRRELFSQDIVTLWEEPLSLAMTALFKTLFTGLDLSTTGEQKIIAHRGDKSANGEVCRSQQVCDHAMEHCSRLQQSRRAQRRRSSGVERIVSNILASGFRLCLASWLLGSRC